MRAVLLIAALSPLPAAAQDFGANGLTISRPWTNAGDGGAVEVYMEIANTGDAVSNLAEVTAAGAEMATFVTAPLDPTGVVPEALDGILLPPGVETVLEPGGLHVLLHRLEAPLEEGDTLPLTLVFEPQGPVEVEVQVEAADATGPSGADD